MQRAEPDARVIRVARLLEALTDGVQPFDAAVFPKLGKWEADMEARNLLLLAASHAKASSTLAWSSASSYPSAAVLARSTIDAGAIALWLLQPDDPFSREARWLAHLDGEIRIRERVAREFQERDGSDGGADGLAAVRAFRKGVFDRLPPDRVVPSKFPDSRTLLDEIGEPGKYLLYAMLSQHVHGTHSATGTYRRNLGTAKQFGEFISPADWGLALSTSWWFVAKPMLKLAERYEVERSIALSHDVEIEFAQAQKALMT